MDNLNQRVVKRVLVMLEYEDGDPDNGEVYDLTALASEIASTPACNGQSEIQLRIVQKKNYGSYGPEVYTAVGWRAGGWCMTAYQDAGRLQDAINIGLPDTEEAREIREKMERVRKRTGDRLRAIRAELDQQKLRDAAAVRSHHPIARVTPANALGAADEALRFDSPDMVSEA